MSISKIAIDFIRNRVTSAYEARCPYCKELVSISLQTPQTMTVLHVCDTQRQK